jgi:formylglycine-generating enzyme required for sulfatase activity
MGGVEVIVPPLCEVPASEFLMGSDPRQDKDARGQEKPQHRVTLADYQIRAC